MSKTRPGIFLGQGVLCCAPDEESCALPLAQILLEMDARNRQWVEPASPTVTWETGQSTTPSSSGSRRKSGRGAARESSEAVQWRDESLGVALAMLTPTNDVAYLKQLCEAREAELEAVSAQEPQRKDE